MTDKKISELPAASSVADADIFPVVQGGVNKKSSLATHKTYLLGTAAFNTATDARITAQKGAANGLAPLGAGSKIATTYLPAIALTTVQTAASEAAQLALTTEEGDVVVRSDESKSYVRNAGTSGTMTDFTMLLTPTDTVLSVNGFTGIVSLTTTDIAEGTNLYYTDERADDRIDLALADYYTADESDDLFDLKKVPINTQTDSYTLVLGDEETYVRMNKATANDLTVPNNSTVAFDLGTKVYVRQVGFGQTTFVPAGGVTINTPETLKLKKQNASAMLIKVGTNEWDLEGNLEAV